MITRKNVQRSTLDTRRIMWSAVTNAVRHRFPVCPHKAASRGIPLAAALQNSASPFPKKPSCPSCLRVRQTPGHANFRTLELPNFRTPLRAFTLIETALAMLAIGLGLLAIFGLGRLSLQAAKETEYDQRCVMMADAVFETLRDYNARFVDEARTNGVVSGTWEYLWEQARQNKFDIPFPPIANMSANTLLRFTGPNSFAATFDKDNLSLTEWNPLYSLSGNFLNPPSPGPYTALHITLIIHPDGLTYSSDQRVFRTTLTNPGGLP